MSSDVKVEGITVPCAGCSGKVTFATNTENPTLLHTMPYCERFESANTADDVIQYMKDCGAKMEVN
jgi:hypothetical protein